MQELWNLNCTIYLEIATLKRLSPYCVNSYLLHITYSRDSIDKCTSVYLWSWVNCIFLSFPSSFFAGSVIHHLYWTLSGDVIVSPSLPYLGCLQQKPTYLAYRALVAAVGSLKWRTTHAPKPNAPQPEHDVEVGRGVLKPKKKERKKWKRYDIVVSFIVYWRFSHCDLTIFLVKNDSYQWRHCRRRQRRLQCLQRQDAQTLVHTRRFDEFTDTSTRDINTGVTRWRLFRNCHQNQRRRPRRELCWHSAENPGKLQHLH